MFEVPVFFDNEKIVLGRKYRENYFYTKEDWLTTQAESGLTPLFVGEYKTHELWVLCDSTSAELVALVKDEILG